MDGTSIIRFQKIVTFVFVILLTFSFAFLLWFEKLYGEAHVVRNEESALANSLLVTDALVQHSGR